MSPHCGPLNVVYIDSWIIHSCAWCCSAWDGDWLDEFIPLLQSKWMGRQWNWLCKGASLAQTDRIASSAHLFIHLSLPMRTWSKQPVWKISMCRKRKKSGYLASTFRIERFSPWPFLFCSRISDPVQRSRWKSRRAQCQQVRLDSAKLSSHMHEQPGEDSRALHSRLQSHWWVLSICRTIVLWHPMSYSRFPSCFAWMW